MSIGFNVQCVNSKSSTCVKSKSLNSGISGEFCVYAENFDGLILMNMVILVIQVNLVILVNLMNILNFLVQVVLVNLVFLVNLVNLVILVIVLMLLSGDSVDIW